jgi:hypothetical protein
MRIHGSLHTLTQVARRLRHTPHAVAQLQRPKKAVRGMGSAPQRYRACASSAHGGQRAQGKAALRARGTGST